MLRYLLSLGTLLVLTVAWAQEAGPVEIPQPVVPVYDRLKAMHLTIDLVRDGKAACAIVAPGEYRTPGETLQRAIERLTGVQVPVVADTDPAAAVPLTGNLICLGNRSTNRAISVLYDRGYTFLDLKYPGPGGQVVNTLHSPGGDGRSVVFAGGSDTDGVRAATQTLLQKLEAADGGPGRLTLDWLLTVKLAPAYQVEHDVRKAEIWEASRMYGSSGYFGWNMLSKHLALYYQTADESHLQEFMRLAFPNTAAIKEIEEYDGERIENKYSPLSGPYHYSAHMMILLWDLVEESPFFTDEQRLKITNAFSAQLTHRVAEGVYGRTEPPAYVGDRHGDWSATSLYVLGRYFQKDYPGPIWERCLVAARQFYSTLNRTYWMAAHNDHLFWFTSYYDPMLNYLLLSGERVGLDNGLLRQALVTQEVLFQGVDNDPGTNASALSMLNKAAHLTGDGRWLWYRERCGLDTEKLRLGQSFWPGPDLTPTPPTDLLHRWTIQPMPEPMWQARASGLPREQSFKWGSFRTSLGPDGDYVWLDGFNGGGRNPYHTFGLLALRIGGATLLDGYHNQVLASADGMVEPQVAMDCALRQRDVVGQVALATAEVPRTPFTNWRRHLLQRTGRYALIADELTFRAETDNMQVETEWGPRGGVWDPPAQAVRWRVFNADSTPPGWLNFPALQAEYTCGPGTAKELLSRLESLGIVLLKAPGAGSWVEMAFTLNQAVEGEVFADLLSYNDRGIAQMSLDGKDVAEPVDSFATGVATTRVSLGTQPLAAGKHVLRVTVVGKRAESPRHLVGLLGLKVRPPGTPAALPPVSFELRTSEPMAVNVSPLVMTWRGATTPGQRRCFFHLLAKNDTGRGDALACHQLTATAAVAQLPEPGLAVTGTYGNVTGDLVLLSERHLAGHGVRQVGAGEALLAADQPVSVDWDFTTGTLAVVTATTTKLALGLDQGAPLQRAGQTLALPLTLPPGRHEFTGARPGTGALKPLVGLLPGLLAEARSACQQRAIALAREEPLTAAPWSPAFAAAVGGKPLTGTEMNTAAGPRVAFAVGRTVTVLNPAGQVVQTLQTDGDIKALHYWAAAKLLLAGCLDEKVIAFDEAGQRRWTFTSEMDKAVWEAGKQYWFKSAHPGVHGLGSGHLGAGELCFVGSACTMEFLDPAGQLVRRTPVFWGPGRQFLITDKPGGGRQLLQARWHNDGVYMAILDGQTLKQIGSGFDGVPAGHTLVGGWDCMNREDNFYADLNGDGQKEVVSAINGTWNRVTVWDGTGKPLANAQFGPGTTEARSNLRQMDLGDLDGDGKPEIVVATSQGMVVALDGQCRTVWARRLPQTPQVMRVARTAAGRAAVVVGCEKGLILRLDGQGKITHQAQVAGRAVELRLLPRPTGDLAVVVTDTGQATGFAVD